MSARCLRAATMVLSVLIVPVGSAQAGGDSFPPRRIVAEPDGSTSSHAAFPVPGLPVAPATFNAAPPRFCRVDAGSCGGCVPPFDGCIPRGGDSSWRINLVPYAWLYELHGDATVRGVTAPLSVSYRDTLRILTHDVDFIFAAKLEIENDEYGLLVDGSYLKAELDNRLGRFDFNSALQMTMVDIAATWNLLDTDTQACTTHPLRFDALGGIRIWSLEGGLTVTGPLGNTASSAGTRDWVDPFLGGRLIMPVAPGTDLQVRGDIGGFGWGEASRLTWRCDALLAMQCSACCSLRAGYRVLDVDNWQGSGANQFAFDAQFRGPIAELVFRY